MIHLTVSDIVAELRMLQDSGRCDWSQPPETIISDRLGIAMPSWAAWQTVQWFGPIDPWLRPAATATDILVDPMGMVTVIDRGMRTIQPWRVHPQWVMWAQAMLVLRSGLAFDDDPFQWRTTTGRASHVLEGSCMLSAHRRIRFSLTRPPYSPAGPTISLRVLHGASWTMQDLVRQQVLPEEAAWMLRQAVAHAVSIIIGGPTGSGKTTLLTALLRDVQDRQQRVIVIEDTRELPDPDHGFAVAVQQSGETFSTCLRHALRQFPSMIVVGEVRGDEALAMLEAASTGHPAMTTIHAPDARSVLTNLERLASRHAEVRPDYVRGMLCSGSVPLLAVYMRQRQVREILEVLPVAATRPGELIPVNPLWAWNDYTQQLEPQYLPQGGWY